MNWIIQFSFSQFRFHTFFVVAHQLVWCGLLSFHLNLRLTFITSQILFVLVAQRKTFFVYFLFSTKVMNESQKNFILPGPLISSIYLVFNYFFFPFNLQTEQFLLVILLFFSPILLSYDPIRSFTHYTLCTQDNLL